MKPEKLRSIVAVFLLAVISIVIIPRGLWHHHTEVLERHYFSSAHGLITNQIPNDCIICKFELPHYFLKYFTASVSFQTTINAVYVYATIEVYKALRLFSDLRAPPY